jgi:hypothetical protein
VKGVAWTHTNTDLRCGTAVERTAAHSTRSGDPCRWTNER